MHSLGTAVYLTFYGLYVRVPNRIASSMRMAHIVTEMYALAANITLSHLDTSLEIRFLIDTARHNAHNIDILTEICKKSKQKNSFFIFYFYCFLFMGKMVR